MVIITCLYLAIVYLVFHKWKLLPWNKTTKGIALVLGIIIPTVFLVGLQGLTPASTQATITAPITEIAPQVTGRVIDVPVRPNVELLPNDVIFEIDPAPYQYRVDQLVAQLADTESAVAQLKEAHDAARSQTAAIRVQLELTELRLGQSRELAAPCRRYLRTCFSTSWTRSWRDAAMRSRGTQTIAMSTCDRSGPDSG